MVIMAQGYTKLPSKTGAGKNGGAKAGGGSKKKVIAPKRRSAQLQHAIQKKLTSAVNKKIEESVMQRAGGLRIIGSK
jgi:hypothetical protein